jgi:tRNA-binding protein
MESESRSPAQDASPTQDASAPRDGIPGRPIPDFRVARVTEAMDHSNADRLLVLKIDLGTEERQIVAGIRGHYKPEELVGRCIVVVANLQHAKLRGEWSQAMLLAAENEEGRLGLLLAPDAEPGIPIRIPGGPPPDAEITFAGFHENVLVATSDGVTLNGAALEGVRLVMDRAVHGRLK